MRCRAITAVLALGTIAVSCRPLPLPSPDQFQCTRGENVVVYHSPDVEEGVIETFLEIADAAWLVVLDITGLPIVQEPVILVDQSGSDELRPTWSSYYQYGVSVHLNELVFQMSQSELGVMLRHELAHLAVGCEYGGSESFVLTEGTAMYVEEHGKPEPPDYSWDPAEIVHALGLINAEVAAEWLEGVLTDAEVNDLYVLSGLFARYWIERFGLESWYRLYREMDCDRAGASVEEVCGVSLQEICHDFCYDFCRIY